MRGWPSRRTTIVAHWRQRDALLGQKLQWQSGEGTAAGIDDSGALAVETPAGRVFLDAGEVHLRAMMYLRWGISAEGLAQTQD